MQLARGITAGSRSVIHTPGFVQLISKVLQAGQAGNRGRNMSKKKPKKKRKNRTGAAGSGGGLPAFQWMDDDGMHMMAPGMEPTPEVLRKMTEEYQKQIRNSPMWDAMVKEFGEEKAEEMLQEFQVKPG